MKKIEIFEKNRNFVKNRKFGQKSKFVRKKTVLYYQIFIGNSIFTRIWSLEIFPDVKNYQIPLIHFSPKKQFPKRVPIFSFFGCHQSHPKNSTFKFSEVKKKFKN